MKKVLLLALLCLPALLKAQQGVVFKPKYQPNKNYKMTVGVGMKITANVTGDPGILQKLKDEGITQPVMAFLGIGIDANIKTGAAGADNMAPMTMDFKIDSLNVSAAGKQVPIPPTVSDKAFHFAGKASTINTTMTIDSVNGKRTSDSSQKSMQQMMSMIQRQVQFPTTPMKPGDTFTQTMPFNVPVKATNGNMKADASITYKLNNIADGKAYFDVTPKFSMTFDMQNISVNMSGTGQGKMVYSIKDNFPISKGGSFNMTIKVTSPKVNVDGTAVVTTSSVVSIN